MQWNDARVFVTGGSSGIGLATARLLVEAGAHVWIAARGVDRLEAAVAHLRSRARPGQRVGGVALDVGDGDAVEAAVPGVLEGLGGLDLLVNNAGTARPGYLHELPPAVYEEALRVNLLGAVHVTRAFLPHFMARRSGHVANVASAAGYIGVFGYSAYSASKFGLVGFSECLRQDLLPYGVGVTILYPTDTDTPQLHEEDLVKPAETRAVSGTIRPVPPEVVARALLRGVAARRLHVVPGFMNRLTWTLCRVAPWLVRWITDRDVLRAHRRRLAAVAAPPSSTAA